MDFHLVAIFLFIIMKKIVMRATICGILFKAAMGRDLENTENHEWESGGSESAWQEEEPAPLIIEAAGKRGVLWKIENGILRACFIRFIRWGFAELRLRMTVY